MPDSPIENGGIEGGRLWLFETLPSTNDWAKAHLDALRHGDIVRAAFQTAGRGRFDRTWVSPAGRGLTLSFILDPQRIAPGCDSRLTQVMALAARDLCATRGLDAWLKWPNDVCVEDRKIAGLLAEKRSEPALIVVGIGLNVNLDERDRDNHPWGPTATSMKIETGCDTDIATVASELAAFAARTIEAFRRGGLAWLSRMWTAHDRLLGRSITLQTPAGALSGTYAGMSADGDVLLKIGHGDTRAFSAGDVTLRGEGCSD
jgi:BirA family transcriptional regulator, biotin operon repressor / biotin---[acetyl-CoA-carboxylase] ligase